MLNKKLILQQIYQTLYESYGPQKWWPAETVFEVIVGAILTQNTNWQNVEKALQNLRSKNLLNFHSLLNIAPEALAQLIQPAGYFNIKTKRLKNVLQFIQNESGGDLDLLFQRPLEKLRNQLLEVKGVGPETADSILLYAAQKPVFVIDQYTYRVLHRHHLIPQETSYEEMQQLMMQELASDNAEHDTRLFNEYHALIVNVGKYHCKPKPACEACPLKGINW